MTPSGRMLGYVPDSGDLIWTGFGPASGVSLATGLS